MTIRILVAIPVKNEVDRIGPCLKALATQRRRDGGPCAPFEVLLFVNNSDDGTADVATRLASSLPFPLVVTEATLVGPHASAGGARRRAMEAAAQRLLDHAGPDAMPDDVPGILLTTDADSRVPPDWIDSNVAAIAAGVDAVAGTVALDPDDEAALPAALKARGALEARYERLVCALETRLDPQPHDPWPRHPTESGASLAVTLSSFRAVGGVPDLALGEDRALVAALRDAGYRIRHDPGITVITSGRLEGRAAGGCADTMRLRIERPEALCDPYLRPVWSILRERSAGAEPAPALAPDQLAHQIRVAHVILSALAFEAWLRSMGAEARRRATATWRGQTAVLPIDVPAEEL